MCFTLRLSIVAAAFFITRFDCSIELFVQESHPFDVVSVASVALQVLSLSFQCVLMGGIVYS